MHRHHKKFFVIFCFLTVCFSANFYFSLSVNGQDLTIPENWSGCKGIDGNVNNDLPGTTSTSVIRPFWDALLGMAVGEEKNFIVSSSQHNYGGELAGEDLFYLVRIISISPPSATVTDSSSVNLKYSLYINCIVIGETTSTPSAVTTPQDNTPLFLGGLGILVIGGGVIGYFAVLKPRLEVPGDSKAIESKQTKKHMNQTKEILNIIQDKKETKNTGKPTINPSTHKSSKRPRRR